MTISTRPRRRQRIASDEAHAWARHLRLGNAYAKSVLLALTAYINDEGACIAGLATLAEDTDLSVDTVRKRLKFLEEIGVIARFPRWRDDYGRTNFDKRGKQTTDEIRLLIDADPDEIEERARAGAPPRNASDVGGDVSDTGDVSPCWQQGLNHPDQGSVRGGPGVGQGLLCSHPLDSLNHEPEESPPPPPSGGVCDENFEEADKAGEEGACVGAAAPKDEPEHFAEFFEACPGWRTQHRDRARQVFAALLPDERLKARAAAPLYASECERTRKRSRDAWKLIRERFWINFPNARLPEKPPPRIWIDAADAGGLALALEIATGAPPGNLFVRDGGVLGLWRRSPLPPDLAALRAFASVPRESWIDVFAGGAEFAAWRERLEAWTGDRVEGQRIHIEPHDPAVHDLPPTHPGFRLRRSARGLRVPCRWPPRRDGTIIGDDDHRHGSAA